MHWQSRIVPLLLASFVAVAVAGAQTLEYPIAVDRVERELEAAGAEVDPAALLREYAAFVEALHPLTREAATRLAASGVDEVRVAGREQQARAIEAERAWRRGSDELVARLFPDDLAGGMIARRRVMLAIWSDRARTASSGGAGGLVPHERVAAMLACVPEAVRADTLAVIDRTIEQRIAALARIVAEQEDARLEMARAADRAGIVGRNREEIVVDPQAGEFHHAVSLDGFNVEGARRAADGYRALVTAMAAEILALVPADQRAVRRGRLAEAIFGTASFRVRAPDAWGNRTSTCADFALNLLFTDGVPEGARADVLAALEELLRLEGERLWTAAMTGGGTGAAGDLDGAAAARADEQRAEAILARIRERIGIERFEGWLLESGVVDVPPADAELARLGITRAHADESLRFVRSRVDARRAPAPFVGSAAATDAGALRLAGLLLGRDAAEGERDVVRALLDRLQARITAEVQPLERRVTEQAFRGQQPKDRAAALDDARSFGEQLRAVGPLRVAIEGAFVEDVRAALGNDAAAVAEAMLAAGAAREMQAQAHFSRFSVLFDGAFGGAPLDVEALALSIDERDARAWLRARMVAHGPRLRACADEFRRHALRLWAEPAAFEVSMVALRLREGDADPGGEALFAAFPEARDYVQVKVQYDGKDPVQVSIGSAPLDRLVAAAAASLRSWRDAETALVSAVGGDASDDGTKHGTHGGAGAAPALVARAAMGQRFAESMSRIEQIERRRIAVDGSVEAGLLGELLAASLARAERALDEALAVYREPVVMERITTEQALDIERLRREIATMAARHTLWAEERFARHAFERLAPAEIRGDFGKHAR